MPTLSLLPCIYETVNRIIYLLHEVDKYDGEINSWRTFSAPFYHFLFPLDKSEIGYSVRLQ
jgi:hypothetical protein